MTTAAAPPVQPPGATYAVAVLTLMNLLNYVDRWAPSAVKELFKKDLALTDQETSLPLTGLVVVYMLCSPIFGSLGDRWPRKVVLALGVGLWSLATAGAALATGFWSFLIARALVGVGEAAYATLSPALISDFYPPERRNRVFTFFYVAIPVGSALGFILGGVLGGAFGWRAAFLACGLPGVLAALLALGIKEPARGTYDHDRGTAAPSWPEALRILSKNRTYVFAVAGYILATFASGALGDWFPTFLTRERGLDVAQAGSITGGAAVLGGLGGTVVGGLLADKLKGVVKNPYMLVSGGATLVAALCAVACILVQGTVAITVLIFATQFFMWFYNGPINAILVNSVSSALRTRAFSLSILLIHLLGDALSPSLVGYVSDQTGNLLLALAMGPVAMAVGCCIWLFAWSRPEEAGVQA